MPNVLVVLIRKFHLGSGFRSVYTLLLSENFSIPTALLFNSPDQAFTISAKKGLLHDVV